MVPGLKVRPRGVREVQLLNKDGATARAATGVIGGKSKAQLLNEGRGTARVTAGVIGEMLARGLPEPPQLRRTLSPIGYIIKTYAMKGMLGLGGLRKAFLLPSPSTIY